MKLYVRENYKNSREFAEICVRDYTGESNFTFAENKYGKPFVSGLENMHFSTSHSGNMIICAVARHNIGADCQIININDIAKCKKIAGRFYSPHENLFLDGLPAHKYISNFFEIWTKKEAYIKYTGRGLSEGLSSFTVDNIGGVCFKRVLPELSGAYIYLCCGEENKKNRADLRVEYI